MKKLTDDNIDYFNGFRTCMKLLNFQLQYLSQAIDETKDDKLRDAIRSWRKIVGNDMDSFAQQMYNDMKTTYGMNLKIDSVTGLYFLDDDTSEKN
jgi:hypothetical protein